MNMFPFKTRLLQCLIIYFAQFKYILFNFTKFDGRDMSISYTAKQSSMFCSFPNISHNIYKYFPLIKWTWSDVNKQKCLKFANFLLHRIKCNISFETREIENLKYHKIAKVFALLCFKYLSLHSTNLYTDNVKHI